eukprot:CAMPEP_0119036164 /NCGR_PEP_ID=MMETSP1177-20130426/3702_1 /TAXON_ID=2985 /ORGANISM="Ochromonas sp, Strain CCMP1899" /LENGTH=62 /DNA_ID=CAMNT_0006995593 /DNA_START=1036 /DNA_END=1224 /DNA_ORIENTATION=+
MQFGVASVDAMRHDATGHVLGNNQVHGSSDINTDIYDTNIGFNDFDQVSRNRQVAIPADGQP